MAARTIARELAALRYPVREVVVPSASDLDVLVRGVEDRTRIVVPSVLVTFWRSVGGLMFVDLDNYAHVDFWNRIGVSREYCDGVMVAACTREWMNVCVDDIVDAEESDASPTLISLSPDGYHKDNISGGVPYGIGIGEAWLAPWQNFAWCERPVSVLPGAIDLVGYLRTAILECAGFPGLYGDPAFEPIRRHLLRNVRAF
ncbi:hypothetical protein [Tahibacter amnicola]|uniref:Uncharacterized protein n=1 Tax=Tahibacter amnicola TaxID=2976241 RepID=A0ABY6BAF3_9GAMM|nr:hypothetical protein [Tahibacter amnicola]UXI66133.1 hypothetical protein N4264_15400 [Tahibacter amnicola]